ncbi:MAG: GxxExxY protein [Nitrospirae bacterium]|nr:GxxExxY protein [Nitrospirota bacterium]
MNTDRRKLKYKELTDKVIQAFYKVYNTLGYGFLEKVYENALMIELDKMGISAKAQSPIKVLYEDKIIGEYFADILVQDCVIVEIKAANGIIPEHKAQLLNYLKATNIEVGLLMNFGPEPEIKRKVFDNWRKGNGTRIDTETTD